MNKHPLVELFQSAMKFRLGITKKPKGKAKKRRIPRLVWNSAEGPAQRYTDTNGQRRYRRWSGPIGGPWIKGKKTSAPTSEPR